MYVASACPPHSRRSVAALGKRSATVIVITLTTLHDAL